jgi:fatty-acyl-CoA synthase
VVGIADNRWGEIPVLVVTLNALADPAVLTTLIEQQLMNKLARYKWPKKVIHLQALPKTALGKVKKSELRLSLLA